jgi:hypothetical protein
VTSRSRDPVRMMMKHTSPLGIAGSRRGYSRVMLAVFGGLTVALTGCAEHKAKARTFPWASVAMVHPILPPIEARTAESEDQVLPDAELDVPPPPSPLVLVNGAPARPRVPSASSGPSNASKFEPPQIVPQLTPQETEAAQQQTNLSLSIAERNIGAAQGRKLNATQMDLASKVRSFVTEAREAAHIGDWTRASSAAKKAEVLSEELARSL